jgi:hypothetical protein
MRSLVAGHAPGKGKDWHGGVEGGSARLADGGNQLCLCFGMRDADIVIGQQVGAPVQFGFMRPVGAEAVKQPAERWMRPARRMHTVGDCPDRIAREHAGGRLLMALRHPVDMSLQNSPIPIRYPRVYIAGPLCSAAPKY